MKPSWTAHDDITEETAESDLVEVLGTSKEHGQGSEQHLLRPSRRENAADFVGREDGTT